MEIPPFSSQRKNIVKSADFEALEENSLLTTLSSELLDSIQPRPSELESFFFWCWSVTQQPICCTVAPRRPAVSATDPRLRGHQIHAELRSFFPPSFSSSCPFIIVSDHLPQFFISTFGFLPPLLSMIGFCRSTCPHQTCTRRGFLIT